MRILVIEPGGYAATFQYAHNLADALGRLGHDVTFATGLKFETRDFPRAYQALEVFDRFVPRPKLLARLISYLRNDPPDLVHMQGHSHPGSYLAFRSFIRLFADPIFVYTAQDLYPKNPKLHYPVAVPVLYRVMQHIFVNARQNKEELLRRFHLDSSKVTVIPLADLAAFLPHEAAAPSPLIPHGKKIILFFGNIEPRKGLADLIAAFPSVLQQIPDAFLLIVGKPFGDEIGRYQKMLAELPPAIRACTHLHDKYLPLQEMPAVVCYSHVWVMPYTHAAPNSGSIATAYGFGLPIVSTRLGGIDEVVDEGDTGYLVPPRDPAALASAIITTLRDPVHYQSMLANVRATAAKHNWDAIATSVTQIYENLLRTKRPAGVLK
jgi:D-inositol-3-phosphate glycosyltransferase